MRFTCKDILCTTLYLLEILCPIPKCVISSGLIVYKSMVYYSTHYSQILIILLRVCFDDIILYSSCAVQIFWMTGTTNRDWSIRYSFISASARVTSRKKIMREKKISVRQPRNYPQSTSARLKIAERAHSARLSLPADGRTDGLWRRRAKRVFILKYFMVVINSRCHCHLFRFFVT